MVQRIVTWIRAHVAVVVCVGVIVIVLPLAWWGSSAWNRRIRTERQQQASEALRQLESARVSYVIPSVFPGEPAIVIPMEAPNPAVTALVMEYRRQLEAQVEQVGQAAVEINRAARQPLVANLFPGNDDPIVRLTFCEALVGKGDRMSAYQRLLDRIGAGPPPDPQVIERRLQDERNSELARLRAETGRQKPTSEEEEQLRARLVALRLGEYRAHARTIAVYATPEIFANAPRTIPPEPPSLEKCWWWQWDYWVAEDLVRAVGEANGVSVSAAPDAKPAPGTIRGVESSAVKRIERIYVEPIGDSGGTGAGFQPGGGRIPSGPSFTNRRGGGPDGRYDVRHAEMTLIVSSAALGDLLNAIGRTNFMTVVGLDLGEVDPWADLEEGYYYGPEHVVRARLRVESVWLRAWTMALMPQAVVAELKKAPESEQVVAAPAPRPVAPRERDDLGGMDGPMRGTRRSTPRGR